MVQIKTFKGLEHEHEMLTDRINTWIRDNNIRVLSVTLTMAPQSKVPDSVLRTGTSSDVMMLITYETE
ncbi:MAG: hypothetical protein J7M12_01985 [Candidatus Hydrogenedentes bacterium]|nr:hypothetical protein [Candidatus Hydrogenedentota bacterium]